MKRMNRDRVLKERGWKNPDELAKGPNGRPLCRFCQKETAPPKRSFCGPECVHQWQLRSNSGYAREKIFERDRGICSKCGLDTEKLKETLFALRLTNEEAYQKLVHSYKIQYKFGFNLSDHFFEVDHRIPVHQGGGSCGLDNLQTLCLVCHRSKTKSEMKRKRLRRKGLTAQWR